jgi:hypothetical protein
LTMSWTVQIALYPLYVGFQALRMADRQLRQTARRRILQTRSVRRFWQRLTHPRQTIPYLTADQPILNTLEAVRQFLVVLPPEQWPAELSGIAPIAPGAIAPRFLSPSHLPTVSGNLATAISLRVRGIASLLPTRQLVLVTAENYCLDVLTLEQQFRLRQRIAWELADYWLEARYHQAASRKAPFILPLPAKRPHALPPVRWFRALMGWMQMGPVAVSANLFHEAALVTGELPGQDSTHAHNSPSDPERLTEPMSASAWNEDDQIEWLPPVGKRWPFRPKNLSCQLHQGDTDSGKERDREVYPEYSGLSSTDQWEPGCDRPSPKSTAPTSEHSPVTTTPATSNPDPYIETEARLVEYVKHPLERLLQWLDEGMVWLEKRLEEMWQWLQKLW